MFFSAIARFTATVVFPTPPLPLATATRFFTPVIGALSCKRFPAAGPVGPLAMVFLSDEYRLDAPTNHLD
jgi:hypothetical protein